jgi:hypothetical protein
MVSVAAAGSGEEYGCRPEMVLPHEKAMFNAPIELRPASRVAGAWAGAAVRGSSGHAVCTEKQVHSWHYHRRQNKRAACSRGGPFCVSGM